MHVLCIARQGGGILAILQAACQSATPQREPRVNFPGSIDHSRTEIGGNSMKNTDFYKEIQ